MVKNLLHTHPTEAFIYRTDDAKSRVAQSYTMSPLQYAKPLSTKSSEAEFLHDKEALNRFFVGNFHESIPNSVQSEWSPMPGSTFYDQALHATFLQALRKGTVTHFEIWFDDQQDKKHQRSRQRNFLRTVSDINTRSRSPKTTANAMKNDAAVMQVRSNPRLTSRLVTLSTNALSATYVNLARFCLVNLEKSHCQTQCVLNLNY